MSERPSSFERVLNFEGDGDEKLTRYYSQNQIDGLRSLLAERDATIGELRAEVERLKLESDSGWREACILAERKAPAPQHGPRASTSDDSTAHDPSGGHFRPQQWWRETYASLAAERDGLREQVERVRAAFAQLDPAEVEGRQCLYDIKRILEAK